MANLHWGRSGSVESQRRQGDFRILVTFHQPNRPPKELQWPRVPITLQMQPYLYNNAGLTKLLKTLPSEEITLSVKKEVKEEVTEEDFWDTGNSPISPPASPTPTLAQNLPVARAVNFPVRG